MEMQDEFEAEGLLVVGVTEAGETRAAAFSRELDLNYPLLAEDAADLESFGVDVIWGTVVFLIDPDGTIVADDLDASEEILRRELGG